MKITGGINLDQSDQKDKYVKADLGNASRHKTNTQKDLDAMLFGDKPAPRRRRVQVTEEKKTIQSKDQTRNETKNESQKIVVTNKINQSKFTGSLNSSKISNTSSQEKKTVQTPQKDTSSFVSPKATSITTNSVVVQHNFKRQQINQEIQGQIKDYLQTISTKNYFNRPSYIRKLKKKAENFNFFDENILKHKAEEVIRPIQCDREKVKKLETLQFYDSQFPAISSSIGRGYRREKSEWKKPNEVFKKVSFGKYIDPNDIQLGKMSSRKFISILGCLSQKQQNIKKLIENQEINNSGFYYVRLNINGVWRYIVVDDLLPQIKSESVGSRSFVDSESDLWVSLIEKAYAKFFKGYDTFNQQIAPQNYLRDLTGSIIKKQYVNSQLSLKIRQGLSKNYSIIAVPNEKIFNIGLDPRYCLNVLGMSENGIMQLRNSWGTITEKSKISLSKEGVFSLNMSNIQSYIDYVLIAETEQNEFTSTIQSKHQHSFYSCYDFKVKKGSKGYICVSQWDQQLFPANANYKYVPFRIIIQKKNKKQRNIYINSGFSYNKRDLDIQVNLGAGDYVVYCIGSWENKVYDYNLTYRGQGLVQFKKIRMLNNPNMITSSLQHYNLQNGKRSSKGFVDQYIMHHQDSNLILITIKNISQNLITYNQDLSNVNFSSLSLLNTANRQCLSNMVKQEIDEIKNREIKNRNWPIVLQPNQNYTWVISTSQEYCGLNLRGWGFK